MDGGIRMKSKKIKALTLTLAAVLTLSLAGCGSQTSDNTSSGNKSLSGAITLAGSTALQPLAEQAGKAFMDNNKDATITVQGGGSGSGLKLVSEGTADIGNSDVTAESKLDAAVAKTLVDHKVCAVGFAIVVSKDVTVKSLTKQQIGDIFSGKITNWKDLGGADQAINVVNRTKSSGTRATFKATVLGTAEEKEGLGTLQDASGAAKDAVKANKGSITYLGLSYVDNSINALAIDGVEANKENITTGKYPFWSYEHMYTKGEAKDLSKAFIDYMSSSDNKALIEKLGYIPMSDMKVK